jgi:murein endopeptidase
MRFVVPALAALLLAAAVAFGQDPQPVPAPAPPPSATATATASATATPSPTATPLPTVAPPDFAAIDWRDSAALGKPYDHGRLRRGVQLPELGEDFFTWDPVKDRVPNREWRRWGTDRLVRTLLTVIHEFRTEHDSAQRVGVMDLSRTHGGWFGANYGGLGHNSHQNGLDVDVLYPRKDGLERRPFKPSQVDRELAQDLVDRFVAAGAVKVFVGPRLDLKGPKDVVVPLVYHDDHLHVRIR